MRPFTSRSYSNCNSHSGRKIYVSYRCAIGQQQRFGGRKASRSRPLSCAPTTKATIYTLHMYFHVTKPNEKKGERSSNRNAFITFPYVTKPGSHLGDNASGMETVKNTGFGQHSRKEREGKSDRQRELSPSLTRFDNKDDLSERIPEVTNLEHSLRQEVLSTTRFT